MRTKTWSGVVVTAALVAVGGCGGGSSSGSGGGSSGGSGSSSSSGGQTVRLAANPSGKLAFNTTKLSARAGKVTIRFANQSSTPHAVEVEGKGIETKTKVITNGHAAVTANLKPGKYEFYCPVDGHRAAGMEGTLTVK